MSKPLVESTLVRRKGNTIFIPLPRELWRSAGPCSCSHCQGKEGFWDTLALWEKPPAGHGLDYTHTVHYPELHK